VHVTAGGYTALTLDGDGAVFGWGYNRQGELGDGTLTDRSTPVPVTMRPGVAFDQLSAGFHYSLALDEGGQAWAWGNPQGTDLGDTTLHLEPVRVTMPKATIFTLVSAGDGHSLALDQDGRAWGWGLNSYGQVGDGSTTDRTQPVAVDMPSGVRFTTVAAGDLQSAALDEDGAVWVWGSDPEDMFGGGADDRLETPVQVTPPVPGLTFASIDVGNGAVAIDENGNAWDVWWSYFNDLWSQQPFEPVPMPSDPDGPGTVAFAQVDISWDHRLALDEDGRVWAWGSNWAGQLGDGTFDAREDALVRVELPEGVTVTRIAAGQDVSYALDRDGNVWAWGYNDFGSLGNGTTTNSAEPVQVAMP
jgi:alpha-tubulin suppressor-like RCC1 family protein